MQMEQAQSDLQTMLGSTQRADSILQLIGQDVDSFRGPNAVITHQILQDNFHVPQQELKPGAQIQLMLDAQAVHYMQKCYLTGQFVSDKKTFPQNILNIFSVTQVRVGDWSCGYNQSQFFTEQQICLMNKAILSKYQKGLLVHDPQLMSGINYQYVSNENVVFDQPIIPTISNLGAVTFQTDTKSKYPEAYQHQLRSHFLKLSDVSADQFTVNFCIPFHLLVPGFSKLVDAGALWAAKNNPIQIHLQLLEAQQSLFWLSGLDTTQSSSYTIKNLAILDSYTILDQQREEILTRSSIMFPMLNYVKQEQAVASQTINLHFTINKNQKMKKLQFAFHCNQNVVGAADSNAVIDNLIGATMACYKSPVGLHTTLPISQVIINFGGKQLILSAQTLQSLHLMELGEMDEDCLYSDPLYKNAFKQVYSISLERMALDSIGASIDTQTIHVQIQLRTGGVTLNGQSVVWSDAAFQNYSVQGHIVTEEYMEWTGRYKAVN